MKGLSLKDVARDLQVKPYQIGYALSIRAVPEPALRVGNRRVFQPADVRRLAAHFGIEIPESRAGAAREAAGV
jgi:DNA-binding transcriptional MerR regulator